MESSTTVSTRIARPLASHPALPSYLAALWQADAGPQFTQEQAAAAQMSVTAHAALAGWLQDHLSTTDHARLAIGVLTAERRTFGATALRAVAHEQFDAAQALLQALFALLEVNGAADELQGWVDRLRYELEEADGRIPDLTTNAGALWLFASGTAASVALRAGRLMEAKQIYRDIAARLGTGDDAQTKDRLAVTYHLLGTVAQDRGDLVGADAWYHRSLEIEVAVGNSAGALISYRTLSELAELCGNAAAALTWTAHAAALFGPLPEPTG